MFRSPKCESITEDRIESNLSKTKNIPPKAYSAKSSDFLRLYLYFCHVIDDFACLDLQQ